MQFKERFIMFFSLKKLLASCLLVTFSLSCVKTELRWDWSGVNLSDERFFEHLALPADFIFGIADSAYQTEGAEGPAADRFPPRDRQHAQQTQSAAARPAAGRPAANRQLAAAVARAAGSTAAR